MTGRRPGKPPEQGKASFDYRNALGFMVRQLYQIVTAQFQEDCAGVDITPVQYAALQAIRDNPENDQRMIGGMIAVDRTTINIVSLRLEQKGLIVRRPLSGRRLHLELSTTGRALLVEMAKIMPAHSEHLLAPLAPEQREEFMRMLKIMVRQNNDVSRVPLRDQGNMVDSTKRRRKRKPSEN